ncbi:MAG: hypothetical protein C0483_16950 [Pirellula sp.]|nr:hypothetical protein [Pirellula sp.]
MRCRATLWHRLTAFAGGVKYGERPQPRGVWFLATVGLAKLGTAPMSSPSPVAPPRYPPAGFLLRIVRSLRLRCPRCGKGKLFTTWIRMHERCSECALDFRREPGFYLGSIYINYGLTAMAITVTYVIAMATGHGQSRMLFWGSLAFCVLFPLWFFRYARSLWLGMDQYLDPQAEPPQKS